MFQQTKTQIVGAPFHIELLVTLLFALFYSQTGCNINGIRHKTVIDERGSQLKNILVIPIYEKSFVIGFGADGKGFNTGRRLVIEDPFIFDSGDDLLKKTIKSKGLILPPVVFIGTSNYVYKWIFLSKDLPSKLFNNSDIFGNNPMIIDNTFGNAKAELIDLLMASKIDQELLRKKLGLKASEGEITVILSEEDRKLLSAYR